jgi:hypothetical protein
MELLLKRDEKAGTFGARYDLFAKLELQPEEEARLRKASPEKVIIMKDDPAKGNSRWRWCLIPGAIAALIFTLLLGLLFGPTFQIFTIPLAAILWLPATKIIFNQVRPFVTVADLLTGRTIHCKNLDELYEKEHEIGENTRKYTQGLEAMHSLGNERRINLGE